MKKISFYILFTAVACIAIDAHKALADEDLLFNILAENESLSFEALSFVVEAKRREKGFFTDSDVDDGETNISISIRLFNQFMSSEMDSLEAVFNTKKAKGQDLITFSAFAIDGNIYHNITCKITYYTWSEDLSKVLFHNCGNQEVRFRDTIELFYNLIRSGELTFN